MIQKTLGSDEFEIAVRDSLQTTIDMVPRY